jgi:hypothetical protein
MTLTALLIMDVQQGIVDRFGGAEVAGIADWTASLR